MGGSTRILVVAALTIISSGRVLGVTVSGAKLLADGQPVTLTAKVVTYAAAEFLYIEEDDRSMGIRVEKSAHGLSAGRADVSGTIRTSNDAERYIDAASVAQNGEGTVAPVFVNNKCLGGGDWHYTSGTGEGQRGVKDGFGLNNVGLLVATTGVVTYEDPGGAFLYLDDGSGLNDGNTLGNGGSAVSGIRALTSGVVVHSTVGTYTTVTGISTIELVNNNAVRAVIVTERDFLLPDGGSIRMCHVRTGSFLMGNNGHEPYSYSDELPQHSVQLSGYWIGKYEVTRGQYQRFIDAEGYLDPSYWSSDGWTWKGGRTQPTYWEPKQNWGTGEFTQTDDYPVVGVSYYEAEAFCNWAEGHLPTEAQWEKAARWTGSNPNIWPWGDVWDAEECNNKDDTLYPGNETAPVGSYPAGESTCRCQDMAGNVWEWCLDWYLGNYYSQTPPGGWVDPEGPPDGADRILRGGSWNYSDNYNRCAIRGCYPPGTDANFVGFRLAR